MQEGRLLQEVVEVLQVPMVRGLMVLQELVGMVETGRAELVVL